MTESDIQSQIRLALGSLPHVRVFRNLVGQAVMGRTVWNGGAAVIKPAFRVTTGLIPGSGDLIGWRTITVTPDMVGKPIAQFLSLEVKTATGKPRPEQLNWMERVNAAGGLAVIARSPDEARRLIQ